MATQVALKNHPGSWLAPDAAASLERYEADHGVIKINEAGRTKAVQDSYLARWAAGGAANRPPYLYQPGPSSGPNVSWHILGEAFDTPERSARQASLAPYGWTFDIASDVVHAQYHASKDQHAGGSGGGGSVAFSQTVKNEQAWLISLGYDLGKSGADGLRGPKTIEAYKAYQAFLRAYGYIGALDGIWGDGTQAAHQRFYDSKHASAPVPASPGAALSYADIQRALIAHGYSCGPSGADNIWGTNSHNALGAFQRNVMGMKNPDYLVGPKTRAALGI